MQAAILTISDRCARGERDDLSGPRVADVLTSAFPACRIIQQIIVPDERNRISAQIIAWSDSDVIDLIITTGGTGFAPRDITPEATRRVIEREAPGLAEAMRAASLRRTPHAMLSRGVCGIRGRTLIINLPGNPESIGENLEVLLPVLPHALELLHDAPEADSGHEAG